MRLRERTDDAYLRFFAPVANQGPSGLADPPRPFVLRSEHLNGKTFASGDDFQFDLHLFDLRFRWAEILQESLQEISAGGLQSVAAESIQLSLAAERSSVDQLRVRFLTPTELKAGGTLAKTPEFAILAARVRDRLSTLSQVYGEGPLALDFAGFGERAAKVVMTRCDIHPVEADRRSGRTGQMHSLGGFVGEAHYAGELAEFLPFLQVAQWTGVGRQTTWGKGAIAVEA
ncbi:MAG: CRISPR system precrRNA processing endoribonuclease RAMP protein Cas6 [Acidobacteriota bacterium]